MHHHLEQLISGAVPLQTKDTNEALVEHCDSRHQLCSVCHSFTHTHTRFKWHRAICCYCSERRVVNQSLLQQHSTTQRKGGEQLEMVDCNQSDNNYSSDGHISDRRAQAGGESHPQVKLESDEQPNQLSHVVISLRRYTIFRC